MTVVCIRHGQSTFNQAQSAYFAAHPEIDWQTDSYWEGDGAFDPGIFDAPLSSTGIDEAKELNTRIMQCTFEAATSGENEAEALARATVVLVSPLTRAIQTAALVFAGINPAPAMVVFPDAREQLYSSCDIGRKGQELIADPLLQDALMQFKDLRAQLEQLDANWWSPRRASGIAITKASLDLVSQTALPASMRETSVELKARGKKMLEQIKAEHYVVLQTHDRHSYNSADHPVIAVVSHSELLYTVLGSRLPNCGVATIVDDKLA